MVAKKPRAGRSRKLTESKLQQLRGDAFSLVNPVRYAQSYMNLSFSRSKISRILRDYNMVSYSGGQNYKNR